MMEIYDNIFLQGDKLEHLVGRGMQDKPDYSEVLFSLSSPVQELVLEREIYRASILK